MSTSIMIHPTEFKKFKDVFAKAVENSLNENIITSYESLKTKIPLSNFIDSKEADINHKSHILIYPSTILPDSLIKIPDIIIEFIGERLLEAGKLL